MHNEYEKFTESLSSNLQDTYLSSFLLTSDEKSRHIS
jgi:hypothetical protein